MSQAYLERLYKVIQAPIVSEKSVAVVDQVVFRVLLTASKPDIKAAIEKLFDVNVIDVRTVVVKGKTKRTRHGLGRRSDWKKAYVRLAQGQEIDLASAD